MSKSRSQGSRVPPHQLTLPAQGFVNQKAVLRRIRNYMAGQVVGLTRDEALLEEVLKCAYCRVHLERQGMAFALENDAKPEVVAKQYRHTFQLIRRKFPTLFESEDEILLGPGHIAYIDGEFASLRISETTSDLVGDIYEAFIGSAYRGQEGQFFTPKIAARALVELTDPTADDLLIDPACGPAGILLEAALYIAASGTVSPDRIHGVDKDTDLARLAQLHLALQFDALFPISCTDSLLWSGNGFETSPTKSLMGQCSLVLTNPPFGAKIVALAGDARYDFDLAYKWRYSKRTGCYEKQGNLLNNPAPQVLFVERCISLLAPSGRLGIVLPESLLSSPKYRYVIQYVLDHSTPVAVIGMPEALFKTSGRGGTHTKVCLVVLQKDPTPSDHQIFMAEAKWCGHDSRGRDIPKNDIPAIIEKFKSFRTGDTLSPDRFGFLVPYSSLQDSVLAPRFYDPESRNMLAELRDSHDLYLVADLVRNGALSISTGDEVGKLAYGTGDIPFVRTSDLSNWEIKVDPKHTVSREVYDKYAAKQDVQEGDILMVRDGTYLIGTCAFVSRYDTDIVYQSHIFKIRVRQDAPFDNYLLLAALSSPPVVAQITAMSFTQDIINSLGDRIRNLILPIPKSAARRHEISETVRRAIESRIDARELTREAREAIAIPA
jgi:type I restriction enzyme M protein